MEQQKLTLRQWREKRQLTQFNLAVKSGVSLASIAKAESGKQSPNINNVLKLLKALEIKFDDVLWPETKPDKRIKGNR